VVSRVIVGAALLNAALFATARGAGSDERHLGRV
jgi:hypothetical protein